MQTGQTHPPPHRFRGPLFPGNQGQVAGEPPVDTAIKTQRMRGKEGIGTSLRNDETKGFLCRLQGRPGDEMRLARSVASGR